ncbi:Clavaminate synthase-like protein [Choiromyces venosus 120613-1]|uniref:Clavaminate synthase-like protein n=1 Tax=Choiromyces venosus 120613-1 TaxID=1336337 RepID=A0A3N4JA91_9PEZI|nr:Clavaminate synthase-like protein [Choiromyces venosus 120613-1]
MVSSNAAGTAVDEDSLFIPLIDFSLFLHGDEQEKEAVAKRIADGFKDAGFIYIKNHGIPQETVDRVFAESAAFFKRPKAEKEALAWTSPQSNRGYSSYGREKTTSIQDKALVDSLRAANPDLKESFEVGRDDELEYPNSWPEDPDFVTIMKAFFDTCKDLHIKVMRAIGLGLGLQEGFFDEYTDRGDNTLRLLHYPSTPKEIFVKNKGQVRAGKHTDYGSITLLFQDERGGLQIRSPKGTFVNATPIPGTIVINAGDLLARWSNGKIHSTEHQVVEPPIPPASGIYPARYSCAYFCNPNFDKFIEAIPGTYTSEADKKYPGINSGDYLVQRLMETYS